MDIKLYEVGGHVRDRLLGIDSKDIDYAVEAPSYTDFRNYVYQNTRQVFLEKPEYFTIRALADIGPVDYVMCRKDGHYSDNRRPDLVKPGTIYDDLDRRDFTINAIAYDIESKTYIDPHNGQSDLQDRVIRCVGNTDRLIEDPLRILRAIRFAITKKFWLHSTIFQILSQSENENYWSLLLSSVSKERRREELKRCFDFNTIDTIQHLNKISPALLNAILKEINLVPTVQ